VNEIREVHAESSAVISALFGFDIQCAAREAEDVPISRRNAHFVEVALSRFVDGRTDDVGRLGGFIPAGDSGHFPAAARKSGGLFSVSVVEHCVLEITNTTGLINWNDMDESATIRREYWHRILVAHPAILNVYW